MSPQRYLSSFIDTLLLTYILSNSAGKTGVQQRIIDDYKKLNEKCDSVILKIKNRKSKLTPSS